MIILNVLIYLYYIELDILLGVFNFFYVVFDNNKFLE